MSPSPASMAGRRRRVLVTRDRRSHPNGSATNREQGDRLTTCHARPVEPGAGRPACPVRWGLLEVKPRRETKRISSFYPMWLVTHAERGRPGQTSWCSSEQQEAEVFEAGECAAMRTNPPTGLGPKSVRTIGVSIPRHGSVQREPASGAFVWRHTEPGCETRPGDPHEKCGRRIAQRCNARNR